MGYRQLAAYAAKASNGTAAPFQLGADPTSGGSGSYVGRAIVGSLLVNTTNGRVFVATAATATSVTWALVGGQV